ncbi:MAG: DUF935 family protein, partial [Chloroflexi bacterium]|nr:DUF935 family protein [Chloroflexota bacterium]
GRDVTRGYVSSQNYLWPQDELLRTVGGGFGGGGAYAGYKLYEDLLQDDRVFSTLQQRRSALIARETEVVPGGESRQDKAAADAVAEMLEHVRWDTVTERMHYGVHYGYSVAECLWARDGSHWALDRIAVRNRRRFVFDVDYRPLLVTSESPMGEELPDRKFWTFATGADNDDEPYGRGLGYYLYWPVWFKKNQMKFWLTALDKFGSPTVKGTWGKGATPAERAALLRAARAVHNDSAIVIPEGMMLELLEAKRSGSIDYEAFHQRMQEIITMVVLSQTMTSEDGSSQSQAEVHMEVRKELVRADAHLICDSFNRGPVTWLTEWNFPGAAIPKVRRVMDDPPDTSALAQRDHRIRQMGYRPTKEYVERVYGIEVEEAPMPAPQPGGGEPEPDDGADLAEGDGPVRDAMNAWEEEARGTVGPKVDAWAAQARSRLGQAESLADFARWIEGAAAEVGVGEAADALAGALAAANLTGRLDVEENPADLADEGTARLPFDEQIEFLRGKLSIPTRAWTDLWQSQHDVAFTVAGAARDELLSDLRGAVDAAVADGETLASFRKRFDGIVAKHGWSYNGGRDWRTRVIYGTNLRTSYAAGRWQQLQAVRRSRPYWRYRHSPASVTPRHQHVEWDGLVLRADDPWWRTHYPPNGWGCNCYVEALSEREVRRLGKDGPDEAPALDEREVTVGSGPGARTVDVPAGIDPGFAYAPGRSVVGDAQRIAIDAAQRRARSAASDAARLAELRIIQSSQAAGFDSDAFRRFIRSSEARDAQEWAVAMVSRERLREIDLDSGALAVRLSSDTAATPGTGRAGRSTPLLTGSACSQSSITESGPRTGPTTAFCGSTTRASRGGSP